MAKAGEPPQLDDLGGDGVYQGEADEGVVERQQLRVGVEGGDVPQLDPGAADLPA